MKTGNKIIFILLLLFCVSGLSRAKSLNFAPPVDSFEILLELQQKMIEAIKNSNTKKLSKYFDKGYDVNRRTVIGGSTLLLEAIYAKKIKMIEFLLDEGADPNLRSAPFRDVDDNLIPEDSPLEAAFVYDTLFEAANMLVKSGANVNDTSVNYGTALGQLFHGRGNYEQENEAMVLRKAKWLIKHGADVNKADVFGQTPLYHAGSQQLNSLAALLLTNGAKADITNRSGETLLFRLRDTSLARLYIKKGADVNAQSDDGFTALHHAVFSNDINIVKLLIENGASVNLRDFDSRLTPLDWMTIEFGVYSNELFKLLIKNDASVNYALAKEYGVEEDLRKLEQEVR
jgi:ankyrin repeat protein